MATTVAMEAFVGHSTSVDRRATGRSTDVDHALALLRKAVIDGRWTLDALAAEMGKDKSYLSRVLNGEKPLALEFLMALPTDVRSRWHQYSAEAHGLVVIEQADEETARRQFAQGLFNLFVKKRAALPDRAGDVVKADLPDSRKSRIA